MPKTQRHIFCGIIYEKSFISVFNNYYAYGIFRLYAEKDNSVSEASSSERDIVFTYSCVKCTDSVMYETSDDITVVSSVDDLNKYKTKLASTVDTEKGVQGDGTATVSQKLSVYNTSFFENKSLIIVRKNFATDSE